MSSSSYLRSAARRLSSAIPHARTIHMTAPRAALYANADAQTFKKVTGTPGRLVLVDFHAEWCGPCHQLSPVLEALTAEPNKSGSGLPIDLVKIDTDSEDGYQLCTQFEVKAMPTVIAFKDGVLVSKFTGALPPPRVKKFIDEL